jgi:hypothetical protein
MTTYTFNPPTVTRTHGERKLQYRLNHGVSVFRIGGTWHQQETPNADQIAAADRLYIGGHVYEIDQAARDELVAAGYGAHIT